MDQAVEPFHLQSFDLNLFWCKKQLKLLRFVPCLVVVVPGDKAEGAVHGVLEDTDLLVIANPAQIFSAKSLSISLTNIKLGMSWKVINFKLFNVWRVSRRCLEGVWILSGG